MLKQQGNPERTLKIGNSQKGFTKGKLCLTSPNAFCSETLGSVAKWRAVDVCLKFGKAFDILATYPHSLIEEIRTRCVVVVNDWKSNWQQSDVPGRMTLGLILSIIFINSLGDGLPWVLCKVVDGTSLGDAAGMLEDRGGTSTSWMNGQRGTPWSSAKAKVNSCAWDGITPCIGTTWG